MYSWAALVVLPSHAGRLCRAVVAEPQSSGLRRSAVLAAGLGAALLVVARLVPEAAADVGAVVAVTVLARSRARHLVAVVDVVFALGFLVTWPVHGLGLPAGEGA